MEKKRFYCKMLNYQFIKAIKAWSADNVSSPSYKQEVLDLGQQLDLPHQTWGPCRPCDKYANSSIIGNIRYNIKPLSKQCMCLGACWFAWSCVRVRLSVFVCLFFFIFLFLNVHGMYTEFFLVFYFSKKKKEYTIHHDYDISFFNCMQGC